MNLPAPGVSLEAIANNREMLTGQAVR